MEESRRNKLYINNGLTGNGEVTFSERSKEYGLDDISASSGATFLMAMVMVIWIVMC